MDGTEFKDDGRYLFTLMSSERYSDIKFYQSNKAIYRNIVKRLLPADWQVDESPGMWSMANPPGPCSANAGFKIHLSTTTDEACALLETVVPIFSQEGISFRVLVDDRMLELRNSHAWGRSGVGKFVTAYPRDFAQFKELMPRLCEATTGFHGPYILSDKRYGTSKVLFYGYCGFKPRQCVTVYGSRMTVVSTPAGQEFADDSLPFFALPEGVEDPFPSDADDEQMLLKNRYKPVSTLRISSKGGVYKCMDLETRKEVVVKEALPLVGRGRNANFDAVDCLKNEYRMLKLLADSGVTPQPIDFFQEWEHFYLVMEMAKGEHLDAHLAVSDFGSIVESNATTAEVKRYGRWLIGLAKQLMAALRSVHERGVVIQDISPRNILFDAKSGKLTFIDLEAAYYKLDKSQGPAILLSTPGFGDGRSADRPPSFADDYKALSGILSGFLCLSPSFFALAPQSRRPMLDHIVREKGLPEAFLQLLFGAARYPDRLDQLLNQAAHSLDTMGEVIPFSPQRSERELLKIIDRIGEYIVNQIKGNADPLDVPTDYRRYLTNPLSVTCGAAGIWMFLHRAGAKVPTRFIKGFLEEAGRINSDTYAPGLYVGSSGVAWTLQELGFQREALQIMDTAARSPLLHESADLFYGAAGWGLCNLYFWKQLGTAKFLTHAIESFQKLKPRLQKQKDGYHCRDADEDLGFAHGAAGIAYFLLRLYQATHRPEHLEYARGLLEFEIAHAGFLHSGKSKKGAEPRQELPSPFWQAGQAGLGSVLLRFSQVLLDKRYLDLAVRTAQSLAGRYTALPTNFYGMAGIGNFLFDMYKHTCDKEYLNETMRYVDRIMLFGIEKPTGLVFPGDDLLHISTDYGMGSAGIGVLFDRIVTGRGIPYVDF